MHTIARPTSTTGGDGCCSGNGSTRSSEEMEKRGGVSEGNDARNGASSEGAENLGNGSGDDERGDDSGDEYGEAMREGGVNGDDNKRRVFFICRSVEGYAELIEQLRESGAVVVDCLDDTVDIFVVDNPDEKVVSKALELRGNRRLQTLAKNNLRRQISWKAEIEKYPKIEVMSTASCRSMLQTTRPMAPPTVCIPAMAIEDELGHYPTVFMVCITLY